MQTYMLVTRAVMLVAVTETRGRTRQRLAKAAIMVTKMRKALMTARKKIKATTLKNPRS